MNKGRMEAFSDGVMAIIITIMMLELRAPHGTSLADFRPLLPAFISYVVSFVFIGIYWTNHHHLFQAVQKVNGPILWANLHLLFWLSLVPFLTAWIGQNSFGTWPVALYGVDFLLAAMAYTILVRTLLAHHGKNSTLAAAIGDDRKGNISLALYALAIPTAFFYPMVSYGFYVLVAIIWIVPDRRIERVLLK
ncbi:MAG TPA: TMEM175 family protein [bacterium]|nr:TMEM175 family protein [bacterium]